MILLLQNLPVLAHTLIGFYFAFYGVWNIFHWTPIITGMMRDDIPHPYLFLSMSILLQFILGLMVMGNFYLKLAAAMLIPLTMLSIIIFHPYWRYKGELRILNFSIFMTHLLITTSALLLLIGPINQFSDLLLP